MQCDCDASTVGKWAGIHTADCQTEKPANTADLMSRSIQRMRMCVEQDAPPILMVRELDQMERLLATLRVMGRDAR